MKTVKVELPPTTLQNIDSQSDKLIEAFKEVVKINNLDESKYSISVNIHPTEKGTTATVSAKKNS